MALYQATQLQPSNIAFDATQNYGFSVVVQSSGEAIDKYRTRAYDTSNDSLIWDTGEIVISPLYSGETLNFDYIVGGGVVNTVTNGKTVKWNIETFSGTSSVVSSFSVFRTNATPVITFTPPSTITSQSYSFTAIYSQSDNVPVSYYRYIFYDINDSVLLQTDDIYNGRLSYTFDGFASGGQYSAKVEGYTVNNVYFSSTVQSFTVEYDQPSLITSPTITQSKETSFVTINIGEVVQQTASSTGSIEYINNRVRLITSGDTIYQNITFTNNFTVEFEWYTTTSDARELLVLEGDYTAIVGYDGTKFYYDVDGAIYNSTNIPISEFSNGALIIVLKTRVVIKTNTTTHIIQVTL